jgi:hypothetical protein
MSIPALGVTWAVASGGTCVFDCESAGTGAERLKPG